MRTRGMASDCLGKRSLPSHSPSALCSRQQATSGVLRDREREPVAVGYRKYQDLRFFSLLFPFLLLFSLSHHDSDWRERERDRERRHEATGAGRQREKKHACYAYKSLKPVAASALTHSPALPSSLTLLLMPLPLQHCLSLSPQSSIFVLSC